jgi:hypothetical protein
MPKKRAWTVTPHGPLEKIDDNLWALSSSVPGIKSHRRMSIVRRGDGSLLFYNAIPMDDRTLEELRAWGRLSVLVITHDQHMIDGDAFREKLGLDVYCPKATIEKVRARTRVTGSMEDLPADPAIAWDSAVGTKMDEPVMFVKSDGGARVSMVTSDVFQNNSPASLPLPFRLLGFVGPRTPPVFKLLFLKDKNALRAAMERWAATPNLARVVPTHGDVIEADPAGVLRRAAAGL